MVGRKKTTVAVRLETLEKLGLVRSFLLSRREFLGSSVSWDLVISACADAFLERSREGGE